MDRLLSFRLRLSFLIIVLPYIIQSQTSTIDSLNRIVAEQENDTIKVKTILQLANEMTYVDLDKSTLYYKQAYELSEDLGYTHGMAESLYRIGLFYMKYKNQPDSSLPYTNRAIAISDSMHHLRILVKSYRLKSICLSSNGDLSKTRYYALKCLELSRELKDSYGIGKVYNKLGTLLFNEANYDSAAIYYMKAIDIYIKLGKEKSLGNTYINLAKNYVHIDENELAEKYLLRALNIKDKLWRRTYVPIVYDNLGMVYYEKKDYKKAIEYFDLGIDEALLTNYKTEYAYLLTNKSLALMELERIDEGIANLKIALQVSREINIRRIEISALTTLAILYTRKEIYKKAIAYYDSSQVVLREINIPHSSLIVYQNLSPIYEELGDYKNAFLYQSKYFNLKDSLYGIEKMETINSLELKYQKKENEARILGLENDNLKKDSAIRKKEFQRNIVSYTALAILLFTILLFAYYRQRSRKNRIISEQQIKQLEEEK
ncbi:MAG: hypothetical protein DRJ05_16355, partial [Bacteroidetes bacterium]